MWGRELVAGEKSKKYKKIDIIIDFLGKLGYNARGLYVKEKSKWDFRCEKIAAKADRVKKGAQYYVFC